ncbi:MAG: M81 family metallopeptidase [Devosiaceae bacterium]|nr:M81 family metallopeptidase [Devosiaceae bacterium MH13]
MSRSGGALRALRGRRIAVGGFHHETNSFSPVPADEEAFRREGGRPALAAGAELMEAVRGYTLPIAGFCDRAAEAGATIMPLLWAEATPSAPVTAQAFEAIAGEMVARLGGAPDLDAVYLCLHGAMISEAFEDGEGTLVRRIRDVVGPAIPIVASLDLHANPSDALVEATDALCAYRTYPHIDRYETGERAAALLSARLARGAPFAKALRRSDYLVPLHWQATITEPMAGLVALATALEAEAGLVSADVLSGFPLADAARSGPTALAYATTQGEADAAADRMAKAWSDAESGFGTPVLPAEEAVARAHSKLDATRGARIVIADTQDNPGAGGTGDTTGLLKALLEHPHAGQRRAVLGGMADPDAAQRAHYAGVDAHLDLDLGGRGRVPGDAPLAVRARVLAVGDGRFTATGPFYLGYRMDLGPMAALRVTLPDAADGTDSGVVVVVTSRNQQMGDQEIMRHVGAEPSAFDIIAVKSSVHFRADFGPLAEEVLIALAPGANVSDSERLPYRHLRPGVRLRPLGPAFTPSRSPVL